MLNFIAEIVMVIGAGVILYLVAQALPRVNDVDVSHSHKPKEHWVMHYIELCDEWLESATEKLLRRARVSLLKLDNAVHKKIAGLRKENNSSEENNKRLI